MKDIPPPMTAADDHCAKPRLPWLASSLSFCTGCGSKAANSSGHQRRLLISLHSTTTEFPPSSGSQRPCRDAGVGAIALGLALLDRAKRASHIRAITLFG